MTSPRKVKFDRIRTGFIGGFGLPVFIFILMYYFSGHKVSFSTFLINLWKLQALVRLMSLCVIPNLLIFLFFYRIKYDRAVRGVLISTFVYAFLVVLSRLFV